MKLAFAKSVLDHPSLVLNRSWVAIDVTSVRRTLCMVYGEAAVVVDTETLQTHNFDSWCDRNCSPSDRWILSPSMRIAAPEVVQLRYYNKVPAYDAPFTRRNLFERDRHTCQYCGTQYNSDRLSIDHVRPRSKGGRTTWENCVLACVRCNSTKGDRSLRDSGLRLRHPPTRPRWSPYLNLRQTELLDSWSQFTTPPRNRAAKS